MTDTAQRHTITPDDPAWPTQLGDLDEAPERLHVLGDNPDLLSMSGLVTVTGSRASTAYGNAVAQDLGIQLSSGSRLLVTGGAYGIDTEVLRGALSSQGVPPIVILSSGLDVLYPTGNRDLLNAVVAAGGLLVSEYEDGTRPSRTNFLRRGQLLAALSEQTVIIEASPRSSTLDVARRAKELGRDVAAVPGPVTSVASAGTNTMIARGDARLIAGADDLIGARS